MSGADSQSTRHFGRGDVQGREHGQEDAQEELEADDHEANIRRPRVYKTAGQVRTLYPTDGIALQEGECDTPGAWRHRAAANLGSQEEPQYVARLVAALDGHSS